jgi:predicted helicase
VTNAGFLDGNSADGLRKSLADEFSSIYVINLRGNSRVAEADREGENVFAVRVSIAVFLLIKNPKASRQGQIFYHDIGEYLSKSEKLQALRESESYVNLVWQSITPNDSGDWINQRNAIFDSFAPIATKDKEEAKNSVCFLQTYSTGVNTARDAWAYNFSLTSLNQNIAQSIDFYNSQVRQRQELSTHKPDLNPLKFSWSRRALSDYEKGREFQLNTRDFRVGSYRPFMKQNLYFNRQMIQEIGLLPGLFPDSTDSNWGFYITAPGAGHSFSLLALDSTPDVAFWGSGSGQFFPRYSYKSLGESDELFSEPDEAITADGKYRRVDNVSDSMLQKCQSLFGNSITKDDIFHYIYGLLHSSDYRQKFKTDLQRVLPRLPIVQNFVAFAEAGKKLVSLHRDYEGLEPYPLEITRAADSSVEVSKMRYQKAGRVADKTTILYNQHVTISGIPERAQDYRLGNKSALDWVVDRYQIKQEKNSHLINDPNSWGKEHGDPEYILNLIGKIVNLSLKTVEIVESLPTIED